MDTSDEVIGIIGSVCGYNGNHEPSQLDWKQSHTRFDYYGYDMLKCTAASYPQNSVVRGTGLDLLEHFEDPEHN